MKTIKDLKVKNKRVLVRVDFNVPLSKKGCVSDNFRIESSLETIKYLKKKKAKIILISHLGRPSDREKKYSLRPVKVELEKLLRTTKVKFLSDCIGKKIEMAIQLMKAGDIILLENLRYHQGETENSSSFARKLSKLGDVYINDAFSVSHREHASIVQLPELLPSGAGLLLQKEIKALSGIIHDCKRPLVLIIGGKKTAKIKALPKLINVVDHLLFNGFLSKDILISKNILIDKPFLEKKVLEVAKRIDLTDPKIHLPKDVFFSLENDWSYRRVAGIGTIRKEEKVFDIGEEAIEEFSKIIEEAGTIVWAGPLGFFEEAKFSAGTRKIGRSIVRNKKAFKVVGGGDTIAAITKFKFKNKFDHVSTGGSSMLKFLCGERLAGIESLD